MGLRLPIAVYHEIVGKKYVFRARSLYTFWVNAAPAMKAYCLQVMWTCMSHFVSCVYRKC